jgi:hypothetical protein
VRGCERINPIWYKARFLVRAAQIAILGGVFGSLSGGPPGRGGDHVVATGVAGEPTAPASLRGGAVSRKRVLFCARR